MVLLLLLVLPVQASAQNYKSDFAEAYHADDEAKQQDILENWETARPNDPELFPARCNYHILKGKTEAFHLSLDPSVQDTSFEIEADDIEQIFSPGSITYDRQESEAALKWIDKGIAIYPMRFDYRFGKIHFLSLLDRYADATQEIMDAMDFYYSPERAPLRWTNHDLLPNQEATFRKAMQDYVYKWFESGHEGANAQIRQISERLSEQYPKDPVPFANIGSTYYAEEDYDKALESFLRAHRLDKRDEGTLANIAYIYKLKGETKEALKYYKKLTKSENEAMREGAKETIRLMEQ